MARVLLVASQDWIGTARLPLTLSSAGIVTDVIAPPQAAVMHSSCVRRRIAVSDGPAAVAETAVELAAGYDRVVPCDDPVLRALLELDDSDAEALLPATRQTVKTLTDKTLFPQAAQVGGIPVPRWRVAEDLDAVRVAARDFGHVVLKGAYGFGGSCVRVADSVAAAAEAARELGLPVLVEEHLTGDLALMACLYERGRLVGALAAQKRRMLFDRGPSSSVVPWDIDGALLDIAQGAGEHFGFSGFVSYDLFRDPVAGGVRVLEINLRPVGTLQLGRGLGVDMAELYQGVLEGRIPDQPVLSRAGRAVPLFPQELMRMRGRFGRVRGTVTWLVTPRALSDVPWGDSGLLALWRGKRV